MNKLHFYAFVIESISGKNIVPSASEQDTRDIPKGLIEQNR